MVTTASSKWQLDLKGFKPTAKNYTVDTTGQPCCITCQDYTEIDTFARLVSLKNISGLWQDMDYLDIASTADLDKEGTFNALVFLQSVQDLQLPTSYSRCGSELTDAHQQQKVLERVQAAIPLPTGPNKAVNVQSIFQQYANIPAKFKSQKKFDEISKTINDDLVPLRDIARVQEEHGALEKAQEYRTKIKEAEDALEQDKAILQWVQKFGLDGLASRVAHALWTGLVKAKKRVPGYDPKVDDPVAKARLLFAWLGYSIKYDWDLCKKIEAGKEDNRPYADLLASGTDVCAGYADMFCDMFVAISGPDSAKSISGLARPEGGNPEKAWKQKQVGHAWAAFRLRQSQPDFKIIDPCWGAPDKDGPVSDEWFSATNASLCVNHVPYKDDEFFVKNIGAAADVWARSRPYFPGEGAGYTVLIDRATILPESGGPLKPALNDNTLSVSFQNNCAHQTAQTSSAKFQLGWIKSAVADHKTLMKNCPKPTNTVEIKQAPGKQDVWTAKVTVPKNETGWLVLFGKTSMFTADKKVVMWSVGLP